MNSIWDSLSPGPSFQKQTTKEEIVVLACAAKNHAGATLDMFERQFCSHPVYLKGFGAENLLLTVTRLATLCGCVEHGDGSNSAGCAGQNLYSEADARSAAEGQLCS